MFHDIFLFQTIFPFEANLQMITAAGSGNNQGISSPDFVEQNGGDEEEEDAVGEGRVRRQSNTPMAIGQKRKSARDPLAETAQPSSKFRKRANMFQHVNVRDPLNLSSVKPDNPNDPNFAIPIEPIITNASDPLNLQNLPASAIAQKESQYNRKRKRTKPSKEEGDEASEANMLGSPMGKRRFSWKNKETATTAQPENMPKPEGRDLSVEKMAVPSSSEAENGVQKERRRMMTERYRYGNFNHYHLKRQMRFAAGMHGMGDSSFLMQADPRVEFFCPDWFQDKAVLDIGSNAGHFAISLARSYQPRRVIGIDLDQHLVSAARKNIRHFCDKDTKIAGKFPASFGINFGPVSAPSTSAAPHFPDNIWFFCENYVLPSDADLAKVNEEYDIIFALACTKWIHLNWGDAGIKRFFSRVFRHLRTGGRFVLETAPFKDYRKHCNRKGADRPPDEVISNFAAIHFFPDDFTSFLLNTVGFSHHEELDNPHSKALGISGRLQVFYKGQFMLGADATVIEGGVGGGAS